MPSPTVVACQGRDTTPGQPDDPECPPPPPPPLTPTPTPPDISMKFIGGNAVYKSGTLRITLTGGEPSIPSDYDMSVTLPRATGLQFTSDGVCNYGWPGGSAPSKFRLSSGANVHVVRCGVGDGISKIRVSASPKATAGNLPSPASLFESVPQARHHAKHTVPVVFHRGCVERNFDGISLGTQVRVATSAWSGEGFTHAVRTAAVDDVTYSSCDRVIPDKIVVQTYDEDVNRKCGMDRACYRGTFDGVHFEGSKVLLPHHIADKGVNRHRMDNRLESRGAYRNECTNKTVRWIIIVHYIYLLDTLIHEFGHSIGLAHPEDRSSIMYHAPYTSRPVTPFPRRQIGGEINIRGRGPPISFSLTPWITTSCTTTLELPPPNLPRFESRGSLVALVALVLLAVGAIHCTDEPPAVSVQASPTPPTVAEADTPTPSPASDYASHTLAETNIHAYAGAG